MKLLESIKVGNIEFKNRIMFPPLTTGYEEKDGSIGEQSFRFYEMLHHFQHSLLHQSFIHLSRFKASKNLLTHVMKMVQSLEFSYSILTTMLKL